MEEDGYIDEGRKEKRRKTVRKGNKENIYIHTHIYIYRKREKEKDKDRRERRESWSLVVRAARGGLGKEDRIEGMITFVSYLTLERAG